MTPGTGVTLSLVFLSACCWHCEDGNYDDCCKDNCCECNYSELLHSPSALVLTEEFCGLSAGSLQSVVGVGYPCRLVTWDGYRWTLCVWT